MVTFVQVITLSILTLSTAQIDNIPQRLRSGNDILKSSEKAERDAFGLNNNMANEREDSKNAERILQLSMSMSLPSIAQNDMSMPIFSGGDLDWPTYSPLPMLDIGDAEEMISWFCRFCPSTICSEYCPSRV